LPDTLLFDYDKSELKAVNWKRQKALKQISFSTKGFGESSPAAPNDTEENR
jgi:outer membrane protein OmpA-like peptidoglycan-associated protein